MSDKTTCPTCEGSVLCPRLIVRLCDSGLTQEVCAAAFHDRPAKETEQPSEMERKEKE